MTTPDELADDITTNLNRRNEADAPLLNTSTRTVAALRTAADSLSALAMALDNEVMAHDRQTTTLDADLANIAAMVRDLDVTQPEPTGGTWFGYTRSAVGCSTPAPSTRRRSTSGTGRSPATPSAGPSCDG
jgi:hypothetical protein